MGGGKKKKKTKTKTKAQQAAAKRHAKFKQTRVQTFGGKKTSFSKAEQKRITDAGYSVKGYSKAPAQSNTQLQVNKDNAKYGNTVPSGSFGISAAGKAQAEANKAEAARKAESARKAEAAQQRADALAKQKADAKLARQFDPGRLQPNISAAFSNQAVQNFGQEAGNWYNKGRLPNEGRMSIRNLISNDLGQQQQPKGGFVQGRKLNLASYARGESNPFRGMPGYGTITGQGQVEGGFQTGPTPSIRQAIERPFKAISSGLSLLKNPKLAIAGALMAPTSLADGTLQGQPTRFDTQAGGLNIGGSSDKTSEQGFGNNTRTGRVLNDIGDAINTYKGAFQDASAIKNIVAPQPKFSTFREDAAEQAALNKASTPLSINSKDVRSDIKNLFASGTNYQDVANTLSDARAVAEGGAEGFKNLSESQQQNLVNSAGGIIDNSKVFQNLGEQYTGSDTFKQQTQDTLSAFNKTIQEASQDTKGRVDPINNLLKNFNNIPGYETTSRFLKTQENPSLTNRQKIQAAYDTTSPKAKALSAEERGIVGSAGNLLIGGKLSDVFKANNPTERGTTFTPTDTANLVANTMIAAKTPGSLTEQRFNEIGSLTGQGTKVSPGTIIRGVNPFGRSNRNSNNTMQLRGLAGTTGMTPPSAAYKPLTELPPVEEIGYIPEIPPQTGMDNSNLTGIQNQSYQNTFNSLMAINPNYSAEFRPQPLNANRKGGFQRAFNRRYF